MPNDKHKAKLEDQHGEFHFPTLWEKYKAEHGEANLQTELEAMFPKMWISVADRLPDNDDIVLVFNDYNSCLELGRFLKDGMRFSEDNTWISTALDTLTDVTHWMPIIPPTAAEEANTLETTNDPKLDNLKTIFTAHEHEFDSGLHHMLWEILSEDRLEGRKPCTFYPVKDGDGIVLAIVEEGVAGYQPTLCTFQKDYDLDQDDCYAIAEMLAEDVFGHNDEAHRKIISSSMNAEPITD